ncbi:hypothetical protein GCM10010387_44560 [Streptomyces inusitatus]|uniref:Uncharacterized protein n=1 Tax=Streptomyces inusitatus TaxID=68221 RepID=A0A918QGR0_9ACTN|nr:hypothetical protein [Streptomyces inusitatus]GGZ45155.1 hypothetical protein GCM10010387_44560 [Streptomyces inusitatus]
MFAALYGELVPHGWHRPEPEEDAYSLFHQRSIAMGWLDDRSAGGDAGEDMLRAAGLWGMNDAGWSHPLDVAGTGLISWFQVEASAVADDRPLPVRPFLRCAEDATAWAGTVRLSAVQILLPVQGIDPSSRPPYAPVPSAGSDGWFAGRDPGARKRVEVRVDSGRDPSAPAVARRLAEELGRLDQEVFALASGPALGSHEGGGRDEAALPPPFHDSFWNGPPLHGTVLRGELAEWSGDAIGGLAEIVADVTARLGVRSPLLFTVTRAAGAAG